MAHPPLKRLAAGREAEILDLGNGRVLRRYFRSGRAEREALVMEHVRVRDYPVPEVFDVRPEGLVLGRVDGVTMAKDIARRPWRLQEHARTLARLHELLHRIPAPDGLAAVAPGGATLHLDLHPENVLMTSRGPVVLDWTNARSGPAELDAAMTWVILEGSSPTLLRPAVRAFLRTFLAHLGRADVARALPHAAAIRRDDPNVPPHEQARVARLLKG